MQKIDIMNKIKPKVLKKLYYYFYEVNKKAYKNNFLLSNPVLSKIIGNNLTKYANNNLDNISFFRISVYFLYSYIKNLYFLLFYFFKKIAFDFSGLIYKKQVGLNGNTVIIDTYFLLNQIKKNRFFQDIYFPGLNKVLRKKGLTFVYAPKFYGSNNPFNYYRIFKILKQDSCPVFTEFQGMQILDFIRLMIFTLINPIYTLCTAFLIMDTSPEALTVKRALYESLRSFNASFYARYLYGCRISRCLLPMKLKCISWYENQSIDKCFYKGLRSTKNRVSIYGSQLFIKPSGVLNIIPDEKEINFGVVPDVILVNGSYYIPDNTKLNYRIGPSLRYKKVFANPPYPTYEGDVAVLLPYYNNEITHILNTINNIKLDGDRKFLLKFHPTTNVNKFEPYMNGLNYTEENLYELFSKVSLVIGNGTGSLVEAVTQGLPVIHLEQKNKINFNPMPEIGKGFVWDIAFCKLDIEKLINFMLNKIKNEKYMIIDFAMTYRRLLFNETDDAKILDAFDL